MPKSTRFQDENLIYSDFYKEVWAVCPNCLEKAIATVNFEEKKARIFCSHCGLYKEKTTALLSQGTLQMSAHHYFQADLWLQAPFKNEVFWAYNENHLKYLERYIGAALREHKDRTHFTLLEKLPKFYHEAKNRVGLLKIIAKLKIK